MQKISILACCYNEVSNIGEVIQRIQNVMETEEGYEYEIIIADNNSIDGTQNVIRELAYKDKRIKAIFNNRNYGPRLSPLNAGRHCSGDAIITIATDLQDPPELISTFLRAYEEGYRIVLGSKNTSQEKIRHIFRTIYYRIISKISESTIYAHASGICLYEKNVYDLLLDLDDDLNRSLVVSELGFPVKLISYEQQKRNSGRSSYNLWRYFSHAIDAFVSASDIPIRIATIVGSIMSLLSLVIGFVYLVLKIIWWNTFPAGTAPIIIGLFFLGSIQLFFIGLIGEYVAIILRRVTKHLPVIERETINIDD